MESSWTATTIVYGRSGVSPGLMAALFGNSIGTLHNKSPSSSMVQQLSIVTEKPLAAVIVAPEDGVLFVVDLDLLVTLPLLGAVFDMQDVLVLTRLGLY